MRIVDAAQMRALDRRTIDELGLPGIVLMERAALGVTDAVRRLVGSTTPNPRSAVVLAGAGNNGGDGSAVARMLGCEGWNVTIVLAADPNRLQSHAALELELARRIGIEVVDVIDHRAEAALREADVCVDALLGIGLRDAPCGAVAAAIDLALRIATERRLPVVSVDVPSGVDADRGRIPGVAIRADLTVTFGLPKWGHLLPPGADHVGTLEVVDIGIPPAFVSDLAAQTGERIDREAAAKRYLRLPDSAHKGDHGHVLVIGGCDRTPGAPVLTALAALRAGAGLATIAGPPTVAGAAHAAAPELMALGREDLDPGAVAGARPRFDAIVFGPGLGLSEDAAARLDWLLEVAIDRPVVVDADGLNLLARSGTTALGERWILTPHPAELARLLGCTTAEVCADLVAAARRCSERFGCTVVAKTAGAVIASRDERCYVGPGHPSMATAGSGDVLAGAIAAMAIRHSGPDAAALGTWLHAAAGAIAGRDHGGPSMLASDLIAALPGALATLLPVAVRPR